MRYVPDCPELPAPQARAYRGGPPLASFEVPLAVITPILGGGARTRRLDTVDIIRPATIRGHLRFWWRALQAHAWTTVAELARHETALWGRAADDRGGRSRVELQVRVDHVNHEWDEDFHLQGTPGAYALWPARTRDDIAPRRRPGTRFTLTVRCPATHEAEVRNTLRAWILFGGYGSRTRRGVGSLTVVNERDAWLPASADRAGLTALFGRDILDPTVAPPLKSLPLLAGAGLLVGHPTANAQEAWLRALDDWLREFRQGTEGNDPARKPGFAPQPQRPSTSHWPEADKLRRLHHGPSSHPPQHNDVPAWPKASFGLPIQIQFQNQPRSRGSNYLEPPNAHLRGGEGGTLHDRLASPLIVKAMPLADGRYAPLALWLHRGYPAGNVVVVRGHDAVPRSGADFDALVAPGDAPQFAPLADPAAAAEARGKRMRRAFFNWVAARGGTVVAP